MMEGTGWFPGGDFVLENLGYELFVLGFLLCFFKGNFWGCLRFFSGLIFVFSEGCS